MARYRYDVFEPSKDSQESIDRLLKHFAPLHMESWEKHKRPIYKRDYDLNVTTFVAMWLNKNLRIFVAYEGDKVVGYLTGIMYRPLDYLATAFQVEDWYAVNDSSTIEEGLFDYLQDALRIMACDELIIPQGIHDDIPALDKAWGKASEFKQARFVRR